MNTNVPWELGQKTYRDAEDELNTNQLANNEKKTEKKILTILKIQTPKIAKDPNVHSDAQLMCMP